MKLFAAGVIGALATLATGSAEGAGVAVTDAKVQGGKLIVTGKTPGPSQAVTLDGRFTITSSATNVFTFTITNYLPSDCIVDLKSGTATGVGTVANCGARGLSPRGTWKNTESYLLNDLVFFQGSSWRAKQNNKNRSPPTSAAD